MPHITYHIDLLFLEELLSGSPKGTKIAENGAAENLKTWWKPCKALLNSTTTGFTEAINNYTSSDGRPMSDWHLRL
jgi:hypothetical protein